MQADRAPRGRLAARRAFMPPLPGRAAGRAARMTVGEGATMSKKKKVRVDLRKNRNQPPRDRQWTRGYQEHGFADEATKGDERVRAKGELSRRRTIVQHEGEAPGETSSPVHENRQTRPGPRQPRLLHQPVLCTGRTPLLFNGLGTRFAGSEQHRGGRKSKA